MRRFARQSLVFPRPQQGEVVIFDTEKFICEVELRPAIWDVCSKSYSYETEKTKVWEEICSSFIDNFEALEKDEKNKEGR